MNDNPNSHDFDWVTARLQCSIPHDFERLRLLVKERRRVRNLSLPKEVPVKLEFHHKEDEDTFSMTRSPCEGGWRLHIHARVFTPT